MAARLANGGFAVQAAPDPPASSDRCWRARRHWPSLGINKAHLDISWCGTACAGRERARRHRVQMRISRSPAFEMARQDRHRPGPPHHHGGAQHRRPQERATAVAISATTRCSSASRRSTRRATPCAVIVEHGGGGSRRGGPIARDLLIEVQRRDQRAACRTGLEGRARGGAGGGDRETRRSPKGGRMNGDSSATSRNWPGEKLWQINWTLVLLLTSHRGVRLCRCSIRPAAAHRALGGAAGAALRRRPGRHGAGRRWSISGSGCAWPIRSTRSPLCCWSPVDVVGEIGMGAQRWIDLGVMQIAAVGDDEDRAGAGAGALLPRRSAGRGRAPRSS